MKKYLVKIVKSLCMAAFLFFILPSATNEKTKITQSPEIFGIHPEKAYTGESITIYGKNFGKKEDGDAVFIGDTKCQEYDFDYIYWSSDIIIVKVPTGAKNGKIYLNKEGSKTQGPLFTVANSTSHVYSDPMAMTIDYTIYLNMNKEVDDLPIYLWLPSAVPSDKQRDVNLIKTSNNHFQRQKDELDLYKVKTNSDNKTYSIFKEFSFNNYQLNTTINPDDVTADYDVDGDFYEYYTTAQYAIESDNPKMIALAKKIVGDEKNPYKKARLIYDWVVDTMDYQYPPPNRDWKAITALTTKRGDCAVYSFLFTAMCRAVGVPARPVAGHVLFVNNIVSMHFWAEFYIPQYGWIPIDANYGDVQVTGFKPREFYFGNMDNRHIAFSKGRVQYELPGEVWGYPREYTLKFLQKYHMYMKNKPEGLKIDIERVIARVNIDENKEKAN